MSTKRLGIFSFSDQQGIVDGYVLFLLENLRPFLDQLMIVFHGQYNVDEAAKFSRFSDQVLHNIPLLSNAQAYAAGLNAIGFERISEFSELILFDHSIIGPVGSFKDMFAEMSAADIDFWGITKSLKPDVEHDLSDGIQDQKDQGSDINEFIQPYFIAFKSSIAGSTAFKSYWHSIANECDDQGKTIYNTIDPLPDFTQSFAKAGFKWSVYCQTDDIKYLNENLLLFYPVRLIRERKCPVFQVKNFTQPNYLKILENSAGEAAPELLRYLEKETNYNVNLIWDFLLRTVNHADLAENLKLAKILDSQNSNEKLVANILQNRKVALLAHIYYVELADQIVDYARSMPPQADIFVTTSSEQKKYAIESLFSTFENRKIEVRVVGNRGRDVSALLVGLKDIVKHYDYICFVHDKKSAHMNPPSAGDSFAFKGLSNTLYNSNFVKNVIATFEDNPRLGLLCPPEPNHSLFYSTIGNEWGKNYDNVLNLLNRLGLQVQLDPAKPVIAPFGSYFWFRTLALEKLFDQDWRYEDFPVEPLGLDATISHAIERVYPFVCQAAGYYTSVAMSDDYAGLEYINLRYYLRELNMNIMKSGLTGSFDNFRNFIFFKEKEVKIWQDIASQRFNEIIENHGLIKKANGQIDTLNHNLTECFDEINKLQKEASIKAQVLRKIKQILKVAKNK